MEVKPGICDLEKVSLSLQGVPSTEVTDKKIMWIFARDNISRCLDGLVSLEKRCLKEEVPLYNIVFISPIKNQYL